jgi:hypothetical protein
MNDSVAHRCILDYTSVKETRNMGKYINNVKCEWENKASKTQRLLQVMGEQSENVFGE